MGKKIYADEIVSKTVKTTTPSTELLTNGGAEDWSGDPLLPTGWNITANGATIERVTDKHSGTYAIMSTGGAPAPVYSMGVSGRTEGEILTIGVWGKVDVNPEAPPDFDNLVWVLNESTKAASTKYWNGSAWVDLGTPGAPTPLEKLGANSTTDWTQVIDAVTVPATGKVYIYVEILGPNAVGFIDDMSIMTAEGKSLEKFNKITINEAVEDLEDGDLIDPHYDKNGVLMFYWDPITKVWVSPE